MFRWFRQFFAMPDSDPNQGFGFPWSRRLALGYPFLILAACGYGVVALIAGLFPRTPRIALFPPYLVSCGLLGIGMSLSLMDPRDICTDHVKEFWR